MLRYICSLPNHGAPGGPHEISTPTMRPAANVLRGLRSGKTSRVVASTTASAYCKPTPSHGAGKLLRSLTVLLSISI